LIILISLVAIAMAVVHYQRYLKWRSRIPVKMPVLQVERPDIYRDNWLEPPTEIRVRFDKASLSKLGHDATRPNGLNLPNQKFWDDPKEFVTKPPTFHIGPTVPYVLGNKKYFKSTFPDWQELVDQCVELAGSDSTDREDRIDFARVGMFFERREPFDWIVAQISNVEREAALELAALNQAPDRWIREIGAAEFWQWLEPRIKTDRMNQVVRLAEKYCKNRVCDFYESQLADPSTPMKNQIFLVKQLSKYRPSEKTLKLSEGILQEVPKKERWSRAWDLTHAKIAILSSHLNLEEPEVRRQALDHARRLADKKQFAADRFVTLLVEDGDPSLEDFFRKRLEKQLRSGRHEDWQGFFNTLDESRQQEELFASLEQGSNYRYSAAAGRASYQWGRGSKFASQLTNMLAGTKSLRLKKILVQQLEEYKAHPMVQMELLEKLYVLGFRPKEQLLPLIDNPKDNTRLASLLLALEKFGFGCKLSVNKINDQAVVEYGHVHTDFLTFEQQAFTALDLVGLRHKFKNQDCKQMVIDMEQAIGEPLSFGHLHKSKEQFLFQFEMFKRVYEFDIAWHSYYYESFCMAGVLNSILEREKIPKRLIGFDVESKTPKEPPVFFFFGDLHLARELQDSFDIKFMEGAEVYYEAPR
jgi:hypothetical protein